MSNKIRNSVRRLFSLKSQYLVGAKRKASSSVCKYEICVIANGNIPTLQLSIIDPLIKQADPPVANVHLITEPMIQKRGGLGRWFNVFLHKNKVTHVIFCRYSGVYHEELLKQCAWASIPTLYCIDDDLLNVPRELGEDKYLFHNSPARLRSVRNLLNQVDLVYCSNARLKDRLSEVGISRQIEVLKIFCAGKVLSKPVSKPVTKIGYMGFDHEYDLKLVLPALVLLLQKYDDLSFELFGKIPKPQVLDQFGGRVRCIPSVSDYGEFKSRLLGLEWDIGICPLANTAFNHVKNNNKWIEYTSAGIVVLASKDTIYNDCCNDGCGMLVANDEWFEAIEQIILNETETKVHSMIINAQRRLGAEYSHPKQRDQLLLLLDLVMNDKVWQ